MKNKFMNETNQKSTAIQRFIWWFAAAKIKRMEQCPDDWNRFTALGIFVMIVAVLAIISGTFFLTVSFDMPVLPALIGGMFWGFIILSIDRVMLAFYHKGTGEFKRILPRIVLAVMISVAVNEPLFVKIFENSIKTKLYAENGVVLNDTRNTSFNQTKKQTLVNEINELKGRLLKLQTAKDDAEDVMNKERGGVEVEKITSGKTGEGIVYTMKKKIFDAEKAKFDAESPEMLSQIESKTQELRAVEGEIEKEVTAKDDVVSKTDFWKLHEAMFSMMWANPIMLALFIFLSSILMGIETTPLIQKFLAEESPYDRLIKKAGEIEARKIDLWAAAEIERLEREREAEKEIAGRVNEIVKDGTLKTPNKNEENLATKTHSKIIGDLSSELSDNTAPDLFGKPIKIEVVGKPEFSGTILTIPNEMENTATLVNFSGQLEQITKEVSADEDEEMTLTEATNSGGENIDWHFQPLVNQLKDDRKLLLHFEPDNVFADTILS